MTTPRACSLCGRPCFGERCQTCRAAIGSEEVTSFEAVEILGITYRQLDYWVRTILGRDTGIGRNRRLHLDELITLAQIGVMLRAGLMLSEARKYLGRTLVEVEHCTISIDQDGIAQSMGDQVRRLRTRAAS